MSEVKQHKRKGRNRVSTVRGHRRSTHKVINGRKMVFVDGFWKHDDYSVTPKAGWDYERLLKYKKMYEKDLNEGLLSNGFLPPRKIGLLTRRIKKINRFLSKRVPTA